ncbi:hypothetical protein FLM00_20040 [Vibrio cholerae]|nr:hypothetical protein FLM00_20040 [Vibrio cholerae]
MLNPFLFTGRIPKPMKKSYYPLNRDMIYPNLFKMLNPKRFFLIQQGIQILIRDNFSKHAV